MKPRFRGALAWTCGLGLLVGAGGSIGFAAGIDVAALKRDTAEIVAAAEAARASFGADAQLEAQLSALQSATREIEAQEYSARMAEQRTQRAMREFESKSRELNQAKQTYDNMRRDVDARLDQLVRAAREVNARYAPYLKDGGLPEPHFAPYRAERQGIDARIAQAQRERKQIDATYMGPWKAAFDRAKVAQKEVAEATAKRDPLVRALNEAVTRRASARSAVSARLAALRNRAQPVIASTAPKPPPSAASRPDAASAPPTGAAKASARAGAGVPLTPFEGSPTSRLDVPGSRISMTPQHSDSAIEQAAGVRDASLSAAAARLLETAKLESSLRLDTAAGPRGDVAAVWANPAGLPVQPLPAAVAAVPAVSRLTEQRRQMDSQLQVAVAEWRAVASKPSASPAELTAAERRMTDLANKKTWAVYLEQTAAHGTKMEEPPLPVPPAAPSTPKRRIIFEVAAPENPEAAPADSSATRDR